MPKQVLIRVTIGLIMILMANYCVQSQPSLLFGIVETKDKIIQGRFEVDYQDSIIQNIVFAPYGISPKSFTDLKYENNRLTFLWNFNQTDYYCTLKGRNGYFFSGNCKSDSQPPIHLTIREFSKEDGFLQGETLKARAIDIQIVNRAIEFLNEGKNWDRSDNRICDNCSYPYSWSLFCALHQASIDIDSEYKHLSPAIQATRQAINEITHQKEYSHILQDFNNEVQSFDSIYMALNRAREILKEKIKNNE